MGFSWLVTIIILNPWVCEKSKVGVVKKDFTVAGFKNDIVLVKQGDITSPAQDIVEVYI